MPKYLGKMKLLNWVWFTAATAILVFSTVAISQECTNTYHLWDILANSNGELEITEGGDRVLKVDRVAFNKCPTWDLDPTGSETGYTNGTGSQLTSISLDAPTANGQEDGTNGQCRINNSTAGSKESHWYPVQGLHVYTPGWQVQPENIKVSDVDMEGIDGDVQGSLRKAALVFGYIGDRLINATWTFPASSGLIQHAMKIEHKALTNPWSDPRVTFLDADKDTYGFGFTRADNTHVWLNGVMTTYEDSALTPSYLSCVAGANDDKCSAYFSFNEPIDGFYIMHALEWKSDAQGHSRISVGPMKLPCGCKCARIETVTRSITNPQTSTSISATTGQCTKKIITDDIFKCDNAGRYWCHRKNYDRWTITGPEDKNVGLWPCEKTQAEKVIFQHLFDTPKTPSPVPSPIA